ncbi:MAG: ATPase [Rhodospirillaceae bacterium]|nr:ATPase [Rhodospirillaceae bacterium]
MSKRFYKVATSAPAPDGSGFQVLLDAKPLPTPAGLPFVVPTRALAQAIASEWQEQGDDIKPQTMAMMQFASTAIDRVGDNRADLIEGVLKYAETDLLCHRAEIPPELAARQMERWQPLLDWAGEALSAPLNVTTAIVPIAQPEAAKAGFAKVLTALDVFTLTALASLVGVCGSLVLGVALLQGRLKGDETYQLSQLDEFWQADNWGEDDEAKARQAGIKREILETERFFELMRDA